MDKTCDVSPVARGNSDPVMVAKVTDGLDTDRTIQEVADYAGCSRQHVYWLIANNEDVNAAFQRRKDRGKLTPAEAADHRRAAIDRLRSIVDTGKDKDAIAAATKLLNATEPKSVAETPVKQEKTEENPRKQADPDELRQRLAEKAEADRKLTLYKRKKA